MKCSDVNVNVELMKYSTIHSVGSTCEARTSPPLLRTASTKMPHKPHSFLIFFGQLRDCGHSCPQSCHANKFLKKKERAKGVSIYSFLSHAPDKHLFNPCLILSYQ